MGSLGGWGAVEMSSANRRKPDLLLKIVDEEDIQSALHILRQSGSYNHAIYHLAFRTNAPTDLPFFRSTYPLSWLGHYIQSQYADIDPVVQNGFERGEPFFWSDLDWSRPDVAAFLQDAGRHGSGTNGFSVPLTDKAHRRALFSVTSDIEEKAWRRKIGQERDILLRIGDLLHRKAILQIYGTDDGPALAPREVECLQWTARGKDSPTIAEILNISEHTVRDYLKTARHKLGCHTIAQTIHEATKRRIINN